MLEAALLMVLAVSGVPQSLAEDRAANIRSVRYELAFRIPESKSEPVKGTETVRFQLAAPRVIVLDFEQKKAQITRISAQNTPISVDFADGHITIPASATRSGENAIEIEFIAGDEALNRNDEFLYTLFVPARARYVFPCFDQPDLKARYSLKLDVPAGWQSVWNETAEPLPTYLFAFAAGKFQVETAERNGRKFRMFHRETDLAKVARNRDAIFDLHATALKWLEGYTAIPYPWGKFDFVLIPSFQFGGMEHPGAITYNGASLLLDPSATQNQLLGRASLIAHETAHMWFGDLVTMRWFNDVWMKEVMANFMAAKIVNPSFPELNHDLRFLLTHYPAAYEVDRTGGSNPIRQELANLNEAGSLYGAIIYNKAPIAMRQLEMIAGEAGFRDGMREYLKKYAFGNATWLDLVAILEARNPGKVAPWSKAWIEQRGRPDISVVVAGQNVRLTQRGTVWPQRLTVNIDGELHPLEMSGRTAEIAVKGRPKYVLPNGGGLGYGLFRLDPVTRRYLLEHIEDIADPLTRGSAWVALHEELLEGDVKPAEFLDAAVRAVPREADEQNTQRILSYMVRTFWQGSARDPRLEPLLREGIARARTSSQKSAWFNAFRDVALSQEDLAWIERVWRREEKIEGLTFAEPDEIDMALNLAVREVPGWEKILAAQRDRTQNPDRKARFEFVMPALSADPVVREQAFARLRDIKNRSHEPWVLESLRYLNHPLREAHARRFVRPALELIPEIQRTGDIFFPKRWADATLGGHRSPEAAKMVREYLAAHPELPERLRWVVLSAADDLFRSSIHM
jgi:aminopeptidase N